MMRIGYFGDGLWSHQALSLLLRDDVDVAFIVARHQQPDPVLRAHARELSIPFYTSTNVNSAEFIEQIRAHACDLLISMSFDQILRAEIRELCPHGFINCHAGALPFYRGRNILNWVLINGEDHFGVTVHHVDEGIDTGDIIVQRLVPIGPDDTYADLLNAAYPVCAETLHEAVTLLAAGTAFRRKQSDVHPVGTYFGRRRPGDEIIDWTLDSKRIHDFVRGISLPGPGARCYVGDHMVAILRTALVPDAPAYIATCGEVVGHNKDEVVIKTGDSTLRVLSLAWANEDGSLGEPLVPRFPIGTRLHGHLRTL
jgi:methionyl-tRNA formyltransferase